MPASCASNSIATAHLLVLLCFEQADLFAHKREPLTFAFNFGAQVGWQLLALPGPPVSPDPATDIPDPKVVQHEQGVDPVGVRGTLLPQALQFPGLCRVKDDATISRLR
jgi:hypothetical protein